jgi:hypothetical protein
MAGYTKDIKSEYGVTSALEFPSVPCCYPRWTVAKSLVLCEIPSALPKHGGARIRTVTGSAFSRSSKRWMEWIG